MEPDEVGQRHAETVSGFGVDGAAVFAALNTGASAFRCGGALLVERWAKGV